MSFWSRISPKRAIDDFAGQWHEPTPHRWQILGVAAAATFAVLMVFIPETERGPPARPEVTYITTWAADRSREEIVASNLANQARKNALAARRAEIEERKKELYRALGRATFIDVDEMEADIQRERAVNAPARAGSERALSDPQATPQASAAGDE